MRANAISGDSGDGSAGAVIHRGAPLHLVSAQRESATIASRVPSSHRPLRVLHVLRAMNRGGIETWLINNLRHINRELVQMEFLLGAGTPSDYDDEIRSLGSPIIRIARPDPRRPCRAAREFTQTLHAQGPYDVVHAHEQEMSGFYLRCAAKMSVPVRIAHSHNDATRIPGYKPTLGNRLRASVMRQWIRRYATHGLACSRTAAQALFGVGWHRDARWQVFSYGIDLMSFETSFDRATVRLQLGILPHEFVVGHIGRFDPQKNHAFLVEVARELHLRRVPLKVLLVGDGNLRSRIEQQVCDAGISDRFVFAGVRSDVPRLLAAMDMFVFPSYFEGLGLVLLEAQAAGLPCVASDAVPTEAAVDKTLFHTLSLSRPASHWADFILQARSTRTDPIKTHQQLRANGFDIRANVRRLEQLYADGCKRRE